MFIHVKEYPLMGGLEKRYPLFGILFFLSGTLNPTHLLIFVRGKKTFQAGGTFL